MPWFDLLPLREEGIRKREGIRRRGSYSGADGEVALPLSPKRALKLAQELLTRGVQAIKADHWDNMYGQGALQRAPDLGAVGR